MKPEECGFCPMYRAHAEEYLAQMKDMTSRLIAQRRRIEFFESERHGDSHYVGRKRAEARVSQLEELLRFYAPDDVDVDYIFSNRPLLSELDQWAETRGKKPTGYWKLVDVTLSDTGDKRQVWWYEEFPK